MHLKGAHSFDSMHIVPQESLVFFSEGVGYQGKEEAEFEVSFDVIKKYCECSNPSFLWVLSDSQGSPSVFSN